MEERGAVSAKKVWSMVRALYFMLRKSKSKNIKLMLDLSMMIKRGKIAARKALCNNVNMFHHQHKDNSIVDNYHLSSHVLPGEYVFSCSNTPLYRLNKTRNGSISGYLFFLCAHALHAKEEDDVVSVNIAAMKALEMIQSEVASPVGLGRGAVVRVTDSPYPIREVHEEDSHVDEAAEEFIIKFYQDLKKQNLIASR